VEKTKADWLTGKQALEKEGFSAKDIHSLDHDDLISAGITQRAVRKPILNACQLWASKHPLK